MAACTLWVSVCAMAAGAQAGSPGDGQAPSVDHQRACLEGVEPYAVCEPLFEAVRIVLACRGDRYTPAYIQGISGAAFRIAGICPCAPTCSAAMSPEDLVRLLGYELTVLSPMEQAKLPPGNADLEFAQRMDNDQLPSESALTSDEQKRIRAAAVAMVEGIKAEVRAGRPVVVWHAFTNAENDVVAGFDDATGEFLGRGSYVGDATTYGRASQYRCIRSQMVGGWPHALVIGARPHGFDAQAAELAALRGAVRHARDATETVKGGPRFQGLRAYDQWVKDYRDPEHRRTSGDSYCYGVYRSTHRAAAAFLREIAPKYPRARRELERAASSFEDEANILDRGESLLWWSAPEGPDAKRNAQAARLLGQARDRYARGIRSVERALERIEAG